MGWPFRLKPRDDIADLRSGLGRLVKRACLWGATPGSPWTLILRGCSTHRDGKLGDWIITVAPAPPERHPGTLHTTRWDDDA